MTNLDQAIIAMSKVLECVSIIQERNDFLDPLDMMIIEDITYNYQLHVEMGTVDLEMLIGINELLRRLQDFC